jgi:hypothetical protein
LKFKEAAMNSRAKFCFILSLLVVLFLPLLASSREDGLVVHEWGTFTSIADCEGNVVEWEPYRQSPNDLPSFVLGSKINVKGTVRMETPVIYFYNPGPMMCSVKVSFPAGVLTEVYPGPDVRARALNTLLWSEVEILPGMEPAFPAELKPSHYYRARETDSAPLRVRADSTVANEKFLFYRGIGSFKLPLSARLQAGQIRIESDPGIGEVILFENREGRIHYQFASLSSTPTMSTRFLPERDLQSLKQDLVELLMSHGLYRKEAEAMVKTWEDSWFEEGYRLFYVLPRKNSDAILPLSISPTPQALIRVLVGRLEIITPEAEDETRRLLSEFSQAPGRPSTATVKALTRFGRFSEPRIRQAVLKAGEHDYPDPSRLLEQLQSPSP